MIPTNIGKRPVFSEAARVKSRRTGIGSRFPREGSFLGRNHFDLGHLVTALNFFRNIVPRNDLTEDGVASIEERGLAGDDIELTVSGIGIAGASHCESSLDMLVRADFEGDLLAGSTGTRPGRVPALNDEARFDDGDALLHGS